MQGLAAFGKYQCAVCGALGVKLWRQYNTFADRLRLMCCDCAGKDQGQDVSGIDAAGKLPFIHRGQNLGATDQIGGLVPAVPTNDGTFWGYTSVPQDAVEWWRGLPNRPCKDPERKEEDSGGCQACIDGVDHVSCEPYFVPAPPNKAVT